jgi:hypothetical protein
MRLLRVLRSSGSRRLAASNGGGGRRWGPRSSGSERCWSALAERASAIFAQRIEAGQGLPAS